MLRQLLTGGAAILLAVGSYLVLAYLYRADQLARARQRAHEAHQKFGRAHSWDCPECVIKRQEMKH